MCVNWLGLFDDTLLKLDSRHLLGGKVMIYCCDGSSCLGFMDLFRQIYIFLWLYNRVSFINIKPWDL